MADVRESRLLRRLLETCHSRTPDPAFQRRASDRFGRLGDSLRLSRRSQHHIVIENGVFPLITD